MPNKHSPCIINLDDYQSQGTHWVACAPSHKNRKILWYFDSFGMHYPKEYEVSAKKDGMKVIYSTVPYINIAKVFYYAVIIAFISYIDGHLERTIRTRTTMSGL